MPGTTKGSLPTPKLGTQIPILLMNEETEVQIVSKTNDVGFCVFFLMKISQIQSRQHLSSEYMLHILPGLQKAVNSLVRFFIQEL